MRSETNSELSICTFYQIKYIHPFIYISQNITLDVGYFYMSVLKFRITFTIMVKPEECQKIYLKYFIYRPKIYRITRFSMTCFDEKLYP